MLRLEPYRSLLRRFGLSPLMRGLLFVVKSSAPETYVHVTFTTAAVALAACYIPAKRATDCRGIESSFDVRSVGSQFVTKLADIELWLDHGQTATNPPLGPDMAKIPGKLMVDLFPDGTVRLVFLPSVDQRNASPVTVGPLRSGGAFHDVRAIEGTCGCASGRAVERQIHGDGASAILPGRH